MYLCILFIYLYIYLFICLFICLFILLAYNITESICQVQIPKNFLKSELRIKLHDSDGSSYDSMSQMA